MWQQPARLPGLLMRTAVITLLLGVACHALADEPLDTLSSYRVQNAELLRRIAELEVRLEQCQQVASAPLRLRGIKVETSAQQLEEDDADCGNPPDELLKPGTQEFTMNMVESFALVCLAAMAAGLTIGLVSLETMDLDMILKTHEEDMSDREKLKLRADKSAARQVLPLLQDHHRLLVTLLLMNSLANEALPLCLDKICPPYLAIILSMTLVLIFGEIVPSSVFTGPHQLTFAARFVWPVRICMIITSPIAIPIARVLDCVLGNDHKGRYNFAQMRAIVKMHRKLQNNDTNTARFHELDPEGLGIIICQEAHGFSEEDQVLFEGESSVLEENKRYFVKPCPPAKGRDLGQAFKLYREQAKSDQDLVHLERGDIGEGIFIQQELDEYKIMHGVMELTHMQASEALNRLSKTFMLEAKSPLTHELMALILEKGFSRIPVYEEHKHNVRYFVLVKKMITVSPSDWSPKTIEDLPHEKLICVDKEIHMLDLLNEFQDKRCHMALVSDDPDRVKEAWNSADNEEVPVDVHMIGIITLEDVIEKMLQEEIYDEVDRVRESKEPEPEFNRSSSASKLQRWRSSSDNSIGSRDRRASGRPHNVDRWSNAFSAPLLSGEADDMKEKKPHGHWT